ncbi:MAG: ABC transporter ATP-binding protein [Geminicoccaceae bacterium]
MAEIRLSNLHKSFDDFVAVRNTNLVIENNQFFVLLGPSGCGKTTTLRMIAGLELPTSGEIRIADEDVTFRRARERDIAFVFQLFALYPHMNVRQNIAFPLKAQGTPGREIRQRVEETARLLRIDHLLDRPVGGLAGGDRQRVALGRAIVRRPMAFLMDEPLGTLDAAFRELMCEELRGLHDRIGATTVYVTHDQIEALAMADIIAVMNDGEVLQTATADEIYHRPKALFVASFIGSPAMNFLTCEGDLPAGSTKTRIAGVEVAMPRLHEDAVQPELVYGIRPEHVSLDDAAALRGEVFGVEYMGARQIVTIDSAAGRLRARIANTIRAEIGEQVGIAFNGDAAILFDPSDDKALMSDLFAEVGHG